MQVRLLGPVDVVVDGVPLQVPGLRRRALLATLALRAGEVVATGQLVDAVWGASAPPTAANTLQNHVSYLRRLLGGGAVIAARPPGYVLDLGADGTDVQVAERLFRLGTQAADPARGVEWLEAAAGLWRGPPLANVAGLMWLEEQVSRLELLLVRIRRALASVRLAAGEHVRLVPELELLAAEYPLDEQVHGQLMLALYRGGRQADALAVFRRLRDELDERMGLAPSQPLRDLEVAILRQDPELSAPVPAVTRPSPSPERLARPVPAQLPSAVPGFAGRATELGALEAARSAAADGGPAAPAAVVISAVSGTAGVGKTALAVHWARQVAGQFPDGQLFVNLRGFGPDGAVVSATAALRGFLDALGVAPDRVPEELDAQAALYRSLLAGRRVLVVLDNALDADQVRPLLPGSPGCLAIVTSRQQLGGLVAMQGAHLLVLDLLTPAGARDLLASRLGEARVAGEPAAVDDIVAGCARLPLALAIAAARAAVAPNFPLAAVAAELREAGRTLDPFDGGDAATDVRAVFSWSYRALSPAAARLFRLLGLGPGPDITLAAAASLAGISIGAARALLVELTRANLLAEHRPSRYASHDLLHAYACELVTEHDREQVRGEAERRLLEHYLHTAHSAVVLIEPYFHALGLPASSPGVTVGELASAAEAQSWFAAEHDTLLGAVQLAAQAGLDTLTWQLAWVDRSWHDQATVQQLGLDAARRTGDHEGEGLALHRIASRYALSGRLDDADRLFRTALERFERIGHLAGQANVLMGMTLLAERQQRPASALVHALRAHDLFREAGHRVGQALVLNDIGYAHALLGDYRQALSYCQQALAAARELAAENWEAAAWDSLGYVHHKLGDHSQAVSCYQRASGLYRERADRYNEADTLSSLGEVWLSVGDVETARRTWRQALAIFEEIDHPDGENVRARLAETAATPDEGRRGPAAASGSPSR